MDLNILITLSITVFAIFMKFIGYDLILNYFKGSMKVELDKTNYNSGDVIYGKIKLKSKKIIQSEGLFLRLYSCNEIWTNTSLYDIRKRGNSVLYLSEMKLDSKRNYSKGESKEYSFKIKIPHDDKISSLGIDFEKFKITKALKGLAVDVIPARLYWEVEVELVSKGVNFFKSQGINVVSDYMQKFLKDIKKKSE